MAHRTPVTFSQSNGMLQSLSGCCPSFLNGQAGFFLVKRAKGARLHTLDGAVLHDFWLDDGRLPFGHAPRFTGQEQKNHVSTGILSGYAQPVHVRLLARLSRILPGYSLAFIAPSSIHRLEGVPHIKNCSRTAFVFSPSLLADDERPALVLVNGTLGVDILAWLPGQLEELPDPYWPDSVSTVRALSVLARLSGPHAPWPVCAALSERFVKIAGRFVEDRKGSSLRIALDEKFFQPLLNEGLYLARTGWIHFCTEHDPTTVDRLARVIVHLKESPCV